MKGAVARRVSPRAKMKRSFIRVLAFDILVMSALYFTWESFANMLIGLLLKP